MVAGLLHGSDIVRNVSCMRCIEIRDTFSVIRSVSPMAMGLTYDCQTHKASDLLKRLPDLWANTIRQITVRSNGGDRRPRRFVLIEEAASVT